MSCRLRHTVRGNHQHVSNVTRLYPFVAFLMYSHKRQNPQCATPRNIALSTQPTVIQLACSMPRYSLDSVSMQPLTLTQAVMTLRTWCYILPIDMDLCFSQRAPGLKGVSGPHGLRRRSCCSPFPVQLTAAAAAPPRPSPGHCASSAIDGLASPAAAAPAAAAPPPGAAAPPPPSAPRPSALRCHCSVRRP